MRSLCFRLLLAAAVFSLMPLFSLFALSAPADSEPRPLLHPKALEPGDVVMIVAPSAPLIEERVDRLTARLEARGLIVRHAPNLYTRYGYLAGDDETRAAALNEALRDPTIAAIMPGTGGYGLTRILHMLDYEAFRQHPKIVTGFSDTTGLHLALLRRSGVVTFHTPSAMYSLGNPDPDPMHPLTERALWRSFWNDAYLNAADGPGYLLEMTPEELAQPLRTINGGKATGRLVGGNLSLIAAVMGTPYEPDFRGAILFLEDVGEEPYRVDRMLSTLRLAGRLDELSGVVLGLWRECEAENPERSLSLDQVFEDYFGGRAYPVLANFPVGHVRTNVSLPMGVMAELDADAQTLRVLEDPVVVVRPEPADED